MENSVDEFETRYGRHWYLRDFDYYPDILSYRYKDLTHDFMQQALKNEKFKIYDDELSAWNDSIKVRKIIFGKGKSVSDWIIKRVFKLISEYSEEKISKNSLIIKEITKELMGD